LLAAGQDGRKLRAAAVPIGERARALHPSPAPSGGCRGDFGARPL
jgi:hypothetical protein